MGAPEFVVMVCGSIVMVWALLIFDRLVADRPRIVAWLKDNAMLLLAAGLCIPAYFIPNHLDNVGHSPPVGVYIAILGLVAVVVTLYVVKSKWEKAAWIVLATVLMVAEVRNLYEADKQRLNQIASITDGLTTVNKGLTKTNEGLEETVRELDTLLGDTTGGDSYPYFEPLGITGPIPANVSCYLQPQNAMWASLFPHSHGRNSLREVKVMVFGPYGVQQFGPQHDTTLLVNFFPNPIGMFTTSPPVNFDPSKNRQHVSISMGAHNGTYSQRVMFLKINGKWTWAAIVEQTGGSRHGVLRKWSDKDFPQDRWSEMALPDN